MTSGAPGCQSYTPTSYVEFMLSKLSGSLPGFRCGAEGLQGQPGGRQAGRVVVVATAGRRGWLAGAGLGVARGAGRLFDAQGGGRQVFAGLGRQQLTRRGRADGDPAVDSARFFGDP